MSPGSTACAQLPAPPGGTLAVSVDTLVCGVHFFDDAPALSVGHKAAAVNLSDMAAMGARPLWLQAFVHGAPGQAWMAAFRDGFERLAAEHRTTPKLYEEPHSEGPVRITVAVGGNVNAAAAIRRDGAAPGDLVVVTGTLGDAGAALTLCLDGEFKDGHRDHAALLRRLEYPLPRVGAGIAAAGVASAGLDLSDGLAGDLRHLLRTGLGARLDAERLPLSGALRRCFPRPEARVELALNSGDDYELCLTVRPDLLTTLQDRLVTTDTTCTVVGEVVAGAGVRVTGPGSSSLTPVGYQHFAASKTP
ncbi:MAG: thiamine-phosphate kinase [Pseudomonadota bacterium]